MLISTECDVHRGCQCSVLSYWDVLFNPGVLSFWFWLSILNWCRATGAMSLGCILSYSLFSDCGPSGLLPPPFPSFLGM